MEHSLTFFSEDFVLYKEAFCQSRATNFQLFGFRVFQISEKLRLY